MKKYRLANFLSELYAIKAMCFIVFFTPISTLAFDVYQGPIIDVHGHAFPLEYYQDIGWPTDRWTGDITPEYTDITLIETTLKAMNKYKVKKAIISGRFIETEKWENYAPDRFFISPTTHGDFEQGLSNVRKSLANKTIVGIGEMFTQYYGYPFSDPLAQEYYRLAEEYDVPVVMHTGFTDPKEIRALGMLDNFKIEHGEPIYLEGILKKYPNLRFQIAHAGYPFLEQTLIIMQLFENVYIDLASVAYVIGKDAFHNYLQALAHGGPGFSKRIMFGTDFYLWPDTQISLTIDAINSASYLTLSEKSDIFCFNAIRFYKLDPKLCSN